MEILRLAIKKGMGKDEEIDILTQLHKTFAGLGVGNSYLGDLFSKKLVDWVTSQIRDDFPPDVMEWLDKESMLRDREEEIRKLRGQIQELLDVEIAKRDQRILQLENWYEREKADHLARVKDLHEMNKLYSAATTELDVAGKEISQLKQTIIELKAELYDWMGKGAKDL
jgi:hypothetical protein